MASFSQFHNTNFNHTLAPPPTILRLHCPPPPFYTFTTIPPPPSCPAQTMSKSRRAALVLCNFPLFSPFKSHPVDTGSQSTPPHGTHCHRCTLPVDSVGSSSVSNISPAYIYVCVCMYACVCVCVHVYSYIHGLNCGLESKALELNV